MQICFIEDTELKGGTQLWVFDAIEFFSSHNYQVTLITPELGYLAETVRTSNLNIKLVTYDYKSITKQSLNNKKNWIRALKSVDVAICTVHPPRNDFHCSIFTAQCIAQANLKTILVTKSGTIVPDYKREFYLPHSKVKTRVIAISEFTYNYLIDQYEIPTHMVRLLYQGINLTRFSKKARMEGTRENVDKNQKDYPLLACIGYLEERKGQTIAIKSLKRIVEYFPNCHLLIVGEGRDKNKLEMLVDELNLNNYITFVPFTDKPENIIGSVDILILPSLYKEGLPNVILEAFAMGIPVVASDIGGISEVVQNNVNGFLVVAGDINQLVEAIRKISSDTELHQSFRKNSQSLMRTKFDRDKQFKKYGIFLHELVTDNG